MHDDLNNITGFKLRRPVFVEGPDGAGKSTLCRQLALLAGKGEDWVADHEEEDQVLAHYLGHTGGPMQSEDDFLGRVWDMMQRPARVFDRCPWISGGIVYRDTNEYKVQPQDWRLFSFMRPLVIYCTAAPQEMAEDEFVANQRGKDHKPEEYARLVYEKREKIRAKYRQICSSDTILPPGTSTMFYNYKGPDSLRNLVINAKFLTYVQSPPYGYGWYTGPGNPLREQV